MPCFYVQGERSERLSSVFHSLWLQSTDLQWRPRAMSQRWPKKIKLALDKTLLPLGMPSILFQFSRHFIFNSCGPQEYYSQKDSFFLLFNYLRKIQREIKVSTVADDVLYCMCCVASTFLAALKATAWSLFFVPLCPGMQVSPSDGEGSGKHLYLKSTLSTVALSERS